MKKNEIVIGNTYTAKVSNKSVQVKILRESTHGGWDVMNLNTNREIRIKTGGRLTPSLVEKQVACTDMYITLINNKVEKTGCLNVYALDEERAKSTAEGLATAFIAISADFVTYDEIKDKSTWLVKMEKKV